MRYGKFPNANRWLEFEHPADFSAYEKSHKNSATWPTNVEFSLKAFRRLLERRTAEANIHKFLEAHPYFLPGIDTLHHGPYEGIVATKFALGPSFVTDFAYIASNSQTLFFTCVEIESAKKRLFRNDGKFHRDYLDARQQISDWILWARQNQRQAIESWGAMFNGRPANWYRIAFRGFLVFGRRAEIDTRVKQDRWSAEAESLDSSLQTMTYDRLIEGSDFCRLSRFDNSRLVVCSYRDRRFIAKHLIV